MTPHKHRWARRAPHPVSIALALAAALPAGAALAQSAGYADDFARDSLRYAASADTNSAGNGTAEVVADGVRLSVDAPADGEDYLYFIADAPGDVFAARVTMGATAGATSSESGVWLETTLYNGTADFGGDDFGGNGDVYAAITLSFRGDGGRGASLCLAVEGPDGGGPFPGFGEEDNSCEPIDGVLPDIGTEYALSIALDREASTLTASIGDAVKVVPVTTPIFVPSRARRDVQLVQFGEGTATATVHGVSTDGFVDDFRTDPVVLGPYQVSDDTSGQDGTVAVVDGRARFDVASDGDSYRQASLRFTRDRLPDYLEADLVLSSESTLSTGGEAGIRLQGRLYNDTAENGFNDREGDVYAALGIIARGDGGRSAQYCLLRNDDANGDSDTPLLDVDRNCLSFDFLPELDTAYEARLVLDREAGTVTFALDDEVHVHDIATPVLAPGNGYREVVAFADNGSVAVAFADDLRTSADALTAEEIAAANAPVEGEDPMGSGDEVGELPATEMPAGVTDPVTPASGSGGSSGGGCSIASTGDRDPLLGLLALLALVPFARRQRQA